MNTLVDILKRELKWYASGGANLKSYLLENDEHRVYAVNTIDFPIHHYPALIAVMARIENDKIIIEADNTDKPLYQALLEAGIPRDKIICAYDNEPTPIHQ